MSYDTEHLEDEFDDASEQDLDEFSGPEKNIYFKTPQRLIKDLYTSYKDGDLDTTPYFQRGYVWDKTKASRLIESIIMGVPIPIVYTAEEQDGTQIVIDGQQRLKSIFGFIDGKFPKNEKDFTLSGLKIKTDYNGYTFKELDKSDKNVINNYNLSLITITKDSDKDIRFEIFERLNTGSMKLNDQEIRNCIYRGPYNEFLKELADDSDFQFILNSPGLKERMRDIELVLRYFTFKRNTYLNYKPSMKQFLNHEIIAFQNLSDNDKKNMQKDFKKAVQSAKTVFGNHAFRRFSKGLSNDPNGYWEEKKVNRGLFDVVMFGFTQYEKNEIIPKADIIREELIWLMTHDDVFIDSISGSGTDAKIKVEQKFEIWLNRLKDLLGTSTKESRSFSSSIKQSLFENDNSCKYCEQQILSIDDAEVDHIEHYWRGGKTIPSNARLLHRYCNRKRGGSD